VEELSQLPGIGDGLAEAILAGLKVRD